MSDPFDRLRDALGDVAVPDQWPAIESRASAGELSGPPGVSRRGRPAAWWATAAAGLALLVTGVVVLANRETADAPATPPAGETVPPPNPTLPCRTDADLAAIVATINLGVATLDYGPKSSSFVTQLEATVVLDATAATIRRSGEFVQLTLADLTYHRGDGPVDALSQRIPAWVDPALPDPLTEPIDLADVRVIAGVEPLSSAPVWSPPLGSFFVGCAGTDIPAIDVHNGYPLLGNPSIDDLVDVLAAGVPAATTPPDTTPTSPPDATSPITRPPAATPVTEPPPTTPVTPEPGPWGRSCIDRLGNSEPPLDDPLAEQPFGPLAPEPGLTVLYSFGAQEPLYSAPVSSIGRVPGGMLIRLMSSGPDGGDQIVAVVDDGGSVRWRRCISDRYGYSMVVDGDVAHLDLIADDGSNATEWWAFDLATGQSTVDELPPPELADGTVDWPLEIYFHDVGDSPRTPLSRRLGDGTELWRRGDLFDPGGEGFRVGGVQRVDDREVVLVRACVGAAADSDSGPGDLPCPYALLGIDVDDGSTVWQVDGFYSVVLVADGYAIVNTAGTPTQDTAMLLDVATGEFVPGGVSDAPGAFYEECCGGYDYNRVESAGGLAWTVAYDHLDVWFPQGSASPGTTVDLLGPADTPTVFAHWGYPAFDQQACSVPSCRFLNAVGSGFQPGATVTAECWGDQSGEWQRFSSAFPLTVSADGSVAVHDLCWYGYPGTQAKVVIDGVESGAITS